MCLVSNNSRFLLYNNSILRYFLQKKSKSKTYTNLFDVVIHSTRRGTSNAHGPSISRLVSRDDWLQTSALLLRLLPIVSREPLRRRAGERHPLELWCIGALLLWRAKGNTPKSYRGTVLLLALRIWQSSLRYLAHHRVSTRRHRHALRWRHVVPSLQKKYVWRLSILYKYLYFVVQYIVIRVFPLFKAKPIWLCYTRMYYCVSRPATNFAWRSSLFHTFSMFELHYLWYLIADAKAYLEKRAAQSKSQVHVAKKHMIRLRSRDQA